MITKSNQRKYDLLGMPYGTANSRLKKSLLFDSAKRLGEDFCYRCGTRIENIDDFSIEHKNAWMQSSDPKEAFFDILNIAYSHVFCNIAAASKPYKLYESKQESNKIHWAKYYSKPEKREQVLERKRKRYKLTRGV